MKRVFLFICLVLIMAFALSGCMGTKDYYKAQIAYYDAQARDNQARIEAHKNKPPLAEMVAPDGTRFVVHMPGDAPVTTIRIPDNPIVAGLKTVVNSTPLAIVAGGWTAKQVLQSATGDINASGNAQVTNTSNSNNPTDIRNADGDLSEDSSDRSNHSDNSNNSDNSDHSDNSIIDSHDQTADPVIVEQPEYNDPIIVQPEVVRPEIVNPVIVPQE